MKNFEWQEMQYTKKGNPFFIAPEVKWSKKDKIQKLDEYTRTSYRNGEYLKIGAQVVHATKCFSIGCNLGFELSGCGEMIKAFWLEDIKR